jgi:di/tricarboxylate transporter
MITLDLVLVIIVVIFILASLYLEILGPAFTFLVGIAFLGFFGVLTPKEILGGFSNEQVMVIIMLLLIGDIIRSTGITDLLFSKAFRNVKSRKGFLVRMMFLVAGFSAFLNNTPLVAVTMPYVNSWSLKNNVAPSKLLMPLSFAAILGGCATLIGTSTNLIVNGLVVDQDIIPGLNSLNIFDFAYVGVPMIFIGSLFIYAFSNKLLPDHKGLLNGDEEAERTYLVETRVKKNSNLIGKTIGESGLRNFNGLYLVEIRRHNRLLFVVSNNLLIEEGDGLVFAGDKNPIAEIMDTNSGLTIPHVGMLHRKKHAEVVEIVISHNSSMIGKQLKDINFRAQYDAAVISIHRNEERILAQLRGVELKAGDVLLLYAGPEFRDRIRYTKDFYFISRIKTFEKVETYKTVVLLVGLLAAILLAAFKLVSLFMGLIILLLICFVLGLAKPKELPKSIDYNLGLIIVMSLALGVAMIKSGAAPMFADFLITIFTPLGKYGILFGIFIITSILGAYITGKAAVALVFPIALSMSMNLGLNPTPFILTVAYAAAANFLTPIGYQTNLMVYGPGGYSFNDFLKLGLPLTIIYMFTTILVLSYVYL